MALMSRRTCFIVLIMIKALLLLLISSPLLKRDRTIDPELNEGDLIPLFVNKIFQRHSGCGTTNYFDLPFCHPGDPVPKRKKSLEEIVKGDCFTRTQHELKFKVETSGNILCEKTLKKYEVRKLRDAISKKVEYDMYYSNVSLRGVVGFVKDNILTDDLMTRYYLVKHINFYPHYYENQVVDISALPDIKSAVDITKDAEITVNFTYSVIWKVNNNSWNETAMIKDLEDKDSLIFWAAMFGIWLGLLSMTIFPYLQSYFKRYPRRDVTLFIDGIQQQIHGDTCKCPPYSSLLGAILGIGAQQLIMITLPCFASIGFLYACNLSQLCQHKFVLLLYCISSYFSGYFATQFNGTYTTHGRKECILQTAVLYVVPVFLTLVVVNLVAWFADIPESAAPVGTFVAWGLRTIIFTILGGSRGFTTYKPRRLCATRTTQMVIPWWQSVLISTPAQMFLGGLLPFMSVLVDMDEVYASFLFLKVCGASFALVKFFICIIIMTIVMAVVFTSYQLSCDDVNWWWRSVLRGGSTAIFIFAYGINFQYRLKEGNLGALFIFICYNACFCYALFLVLGAISFSVSLYVYGTEKLELHKRD